MRRELVGNVHVDILPHGLHLNEAMRLARLLFCHDTDRITGGYCCCCCCFCFNRTPDAEAGSPGRELR